MHDKVHNARYYLPWTGCVQGGTCCDIVSSLQSSAGCFIAAELWLCRCACPEWWPDARAEYFQAQELSAKTPELYFNTRPSKQLFWLGEHVVIGLELYSRSEQPILVSRLQGAEFVSFNVTGPDGNEVPWQGETLADTQRYSSSDFRVLGQYKAISANRIISLKDGTGFAFNKPGQYSLTANFPWAPQKISPRLKSRRSLLWAPFRRNWHFA
jgi:hypothetical protein